MTLEDFERSLVENSKSEGDKKSFDREKDGRRHRKHCHHHREEREDHHKRKRRRHSYNESQSPHHGHKRTQECPRQDRSIEGTHNIQEESGGRDAATPSPAEKERNTNSKHQIERDAWMQNPSAVDVYFTQKRARLSLEPVATGSSRADFELKIHDNELNKHHLQNISDGKGVPQILPDENLKYEVDYQFGDAGAQWRMTRLKSVYRRAEETGMSVEDVAEDQYGNLRAFDDAREEQTELDRRETYGENYVRKEKPSGEFFEERRLALALRMNLTASSNNEMDGHAELSPQESEAKDLNPGIVSMDQTALNRLKAQMLKAKVRGSSDAHQLEVEYESAMTAFASHKQSGSIVLGGMDNRMLAGSRKGEIKSIDNKRGRERGLVEESEDMSIDDMVRQERRNRHQAGGDGQRFAERIAKDAKFDNDLDYMDENANKLARRVQKSELNLKNTAISDFQRMNRILDKCPLCHHEDTSTPPIAPVVSLATRVYLTLPTEPEITDGGACIIPVQHRGNLLECDDDEWEEIRNFMKSLTRMYHDQGRDVIFYENAAAPQRKKHASMEVIPLPYSLGETAPAFFKEAILTSDEEWTQHQKIIDTRGKARNGLGKWAFRRTLVKEMPYFHVWFEIDGGIGHVVEESNRWPKGDLFAREVIGGMLDKEPDIIKRQGRWEKGGDRRIDGFRKRWRKFDWTRVLTESETRTLEKKF